MGYKVKRASLFEVEEPPKPALTVDMRHLSSLLRLRIAPEPHLPPSTSITCLLNTFTGVQRCGQPQIVVAACLLDRREAHRRRESRMRMGRRPRRSVAGRV